MSGRSGYSRRLRVTTSTAYAASLARVSDEEFIATVAALGLPASPRTADPRRGPRGAGHTRGRTNDPKRRERLQTAIYKLADDRTT
jgi:hypothetical protein